jgi:hypothetical protein
MAFTSEMSKFEARYSVWKYVILVPLVCLQVIIAWSWCVFVWGKLNW